MLQSIAETTKSYSELGSRTMPLVHDVVSATTELGINLDDAVQNLTAAQRNSAQNYPDDNIVRIDRFFNPIIFNCVAFPPRASQLTS